MSNHPGPFHQQHSPMLSYLMYIVLSMDNVSSVWEKDDYKTNYSYDNHC
jgi:hypothetical protein